MPAVALPQADPDPPDPDSVPIKTRVQNRVQRQVREQLKNLNIEVDDDDNNPAPAPAQTAIDPRSIHAASFGDRLDLTRQWLFSAEDVPDGASSTLDDHAWGSIDTSKVFFTQEIFNPNRVWYRAHVHLTPGAHDLAVTIAEFGGSFRVYANGRELGGYGRMSGRGDFLICRSATFAIPNAVLAQSPDLVLAIRAYVGTVDRATFTLDDGISARSSVFLGPAQVLARDQRFYYATGLSEGVGILTLWGVLLVLAVALWFLIPKTPAYPLLALFAGGHLVSLLLIDFMEFHYLAKTHWLAWPTRLALIASDLAALEFCRIIAGLRRRAWFLAFEVFYILAVASILPAALGLISFLIHSALIRLSSWLLFGLIAILILLGIRRRKQDAVILASVGGVYLFYLAVWKGLQYVVFSYLFLQRTADAFVAHVRPTPTGDLAIVIGFLALTLVRTLRIVRERASIATEIQAARTMQQLLLGRSAEPTPGFAIDTVYIPAGEVGGDFFLVSPNPDSSITIILGDVSGKGLLAAMRVSMILGVLRREPSRQPCAMLEGLNEALLAQHEMGFTTAIAVRLEPDGRYTVANAGHISPYLLGQEIGTPPALPLGLAGGQSYDSVTGKLKPGERLVILSDGVPEARTPKGELYGFERLGQLTLQPASVIASTAQSFGQDDDITVVTIACVPTAGAVPPPPPPAVRRAATPPPPLVVIPA